jgi:hypothetical protein
MRARQKVVGFSSTEGKDAMGGLVKRQVPGFG